MTDQNLALPNKTIANYRADAVESFRNYKMMAERAAKQVSDEESIAVIVASSQRCRI